MTAPRLIGRDRFAKTGPCQQGPVGTGYFKITPHAHTRGVINDKPAPCGPFMIKQGPVGTGFLICLLTRERDAHTRKGVQPGNRSLPVPVRVLT